jgi:RHS repeat-associated protein
VWLRGDSVAYYTHDGSKNVSEAVARNGDVVAYYEYAPFGAITLMRDESTGENPWRFSCEYSDDVLGLLHFNYRHYSVNDGRWLSYDRNEDVALMGYLFCKNSPLEIFDYLGLSPVSGASSVHGRGGEGQFDSIASKASDNWTSVKTGNDILEDMKRLSKSENCIEKYTIAGHGWAHKDGEGRALGPGIPGGGEDTGFYTEKRKGAGSVGIPELKKAVGDGSICFCKKCKIQIFSCRIAPAFSLMLAKATGCSVVSASSSCRRLDSGKWRSAPGSYDEKLQGGHFGFTESTPSGTKEKEMDYEPF